MAIRSVRQRWMLCWSVALLGVLISLLSTRAFRQADDRQLAVAFAHEAEQYALAIAHELTDGLAAVESIAAVFTATGRLTRDEFRRATAHLLVRHPSLRALGWDPRVSDAERAGHESSVRDGGLPAYRITERSPAGELVEAGRRADYVVVQYIEPIVGNEPAIGFDVGSEPNRRSALEQAAATGRVGLTAKVDLVQQANAPGFLAFWPVRRESDGPEGSARDARVSGFVVGVFEVARIIERVTRAAERDGTTIRIEDVTEPDAVDLLYAHRVEGGPEASADLDSPFVHVETLERGGRTWRMHFYPSASLIAERRSALPAVALAVGLVLTALLSAYLWLVLRANAGLEREIARRRNAEKERRHLDAKLREAQKLESLGVLAGGIAHDFNNLLTGILGNTDLALAHVPEHAPEREELEEVRLAATRAAELTGQMLAYTGSRPFAPVPFELTRVVDEMSNLLDASVSKSARLQRMFATEPLWVEGEPTQIRQVVMNLITNASESLGERGGVIHVETGMRHFDRATLAGAYLDRTPGPGPLVFLEVTDEGCGMTAEQRARVFDPFYSTKFTGRGLGLAAVLGIVRTHQGAIWVESEPDKGSKLTVAFPVSAPPDHDELRVTGRGPERMGTGVVLVVDDEQAVRRVAARALTDLGYEVVTAADGSEALALFRARADEIRLVLLDSTMPGLSGADTFRAVREIRADARIILSSGFAGEDLPHDRAGEPVDGFLGKPYTRSDLGQIVDRVLA